MNKVTHTEVRSVTIRMDQTAVYQLTLSSILISHPEKVLPKRPTNLKASPQERDNKSNVGMLYMCNAHYHKLSD